MAVNKYKEHLMILCEDGAYLALANAFLLTPAIADKQIRAVPTLGEGTEKLFTMFFKQHAKDGAKNNKRHFLLLFDLDNGQKQHAFDCFYEQLKQNFPALTQRVFFLSCKNEAESLKQEVKIPNKKIGEAIAEECSTTKGGPCPPGSLWHCEQLKHNQTQLSLLSQAVRSFLFT